MLDPKLYRSPWRDFRDVVIQTTVTHLRSRPGYSEAKRGAGEAAYHVVQEVFKPQKIPFTFDTIVPIMQFDRESPNALPLVYAAMLAKHFPCRLETGILQANIVSHTLADAQTRILGQPIFMGKIEPGSQVLIVDDVVTYGSTLANLRGWLEQQGATVVGATTLAAGFGGTKVALPDAIRDRLLDRFPARAEVLANEFGFSADCFTNREARFLAGLKTEHDLELLIDAARELSAIQQRHASMTLADEIELPSR
jgi:Phosphoribosyl transferase domain